MTDYGPRDVLPLILIRGFGGLDVREEIADTHQGFNTGTVYPHKFGENYIFEGMVLRFIKSMWGYLDATNVVGFYPEGVTQQSMGDPAGAGYTSDVEAQIEHGFMPWVRDKAAAKDRIRAWDQKGYLTGSVVLDVKGALDLSQADQPARSLWVFRFYDLKSRRMKGYGGHLAKLIRIVCDVTGAPAVNIVAHSMGGLLVRALIQDPEDDFREERERINKLVTLGTPHKGIAFQHLPDVMLVNLLQAGDELAYFNPENQEPERARAGQQQTVHAAYSYTRLAERFDLKRLMCVVGTNFASYDNRIASLLNRLFAFEGDGGRLYNKSDGLVKQRSAMLEGAFRTYVHKCHGGPDSVVTSREAYEIANRFFFGDRLVRLYFRDGRITKKAGIFGWLGRPEYYVGVSVKPRGVDFDLFHQSKEAENCYGPFNDDELSGLRAADDGLLCELFLDTRRSLSESGEVAFRLMFYISERDEQVFAYSDDVILHRPMYIRAVPDTDGRGFKLQYYDDTVDQDDWLDCERGDGWWGFPLTNPYFKGRFALTIEDV